MPKLTVFAGLVSLASLGQSHTTFMRIALNGEWQTPTRFIRNKTDPFIEPVNPADPTALSRDWVFPTYPTDFPDSIRCGRGNLDHAQETETLKVKAGDTIEMLAYRYSPINWSTNKYVQWDNCPEGRGGCDKEYPNQFGVGHDGPIVVHLSKPPAGKDLNAYDGSGEWVKIHTIGMEIRPERYAAPIVWLPTGVDGEERPRYKFKLPTQTPAGKYLLRIDQIWPGLLDDFGEGGEPVYVDPQLYPACAQIEVQSEVTGDLPKGIKIPEGLSKYSQGMTVTNEQYQRRKVDKGYVYPGGPLWDGEKLVEDKAPSM